MAEEEDPRPRTPAPEQGTQLAADNADGSAKSRCRREGPDHPHRVLHTICVPTHQRRCARTQIGDRVPRTSPVIPAPRYQRGEDQTAAD